MTTVLNRRKVDLHCTNGISLKLLRAQSNIRWKRALRGIVGTTNLSWNPVALTQAPWRRGLSMPVNGNRKPQRKKDNLSNLSPLHFFPTASRFHDAHQRYSLHGASYSHPQCSVCPFCMRPMPLGCTTGEDATILTGIP